MAQTKKTAKLKKPPLYRVVILKDILTPENFIENVIKENFSMRQRDVKAKMQEVASSGMSICGEYTRDVAETKVNMINNAARMNHYPILSMVEQAAQ